MTELPAPVTVTCLYRPPDTDSSHGQEITTDGHQRASNPGGTNYSDIINVADAVKDATLNLVNSTATAHDSSNKDLIHITYGGQTTTNPDLVPVILLSILLKTLF